MDIPSSAIGSAIKKRVSEDEEPAAFLTSGILLNVALAGLAFIAAGLAGEHIEAYVDAPVAGLFALLIAAKISFGSTIAGLNGQKLVAYAGSLRLFERLFRIASQVALLVFAYGIAGLILGQVFSLVIASAIGLWLYRIGFALPRLRHVRRLLGYARYSWLGALKSRVLGPSVDVLILQAIIGSTSLVGIYQISWNVASILVLVSLSIQETLFPEISELAAGDEYAKVRELLGEALVFTGIFAIPGFLGAVVLGDRILHIYGGAFVKGQGILLILIVARTVASFTSQLTSAINAIDRPELGFRLNLLFLGANVGLNLLLVPAFGWYGAATATALAATIALVANYHVLVREIGNIKTPTQEVGKQVLAALLMVTVVRGTELVVPWQNDYVTVALVILGAVVYGVALLGLSRWVREKAFSLVPASVLPQ